jgi:hypothetical protein
MVGETRRALGLLFFMIVGGWLTSHFAAPGTSWIGRHAAGVFVYALSITDAYRLAAIRHAESSLSGRSPH